MLAWANLLFLCVLMLIMNSEKLRNKVAKLFGSNAANVNYNTPCYDEQLMHSNTLYPICHKLEEHNRVAGKIEPFRPTDAEYYRALLLNGSMICGKEHRSLRFLKGTKNRYE